MRRGWGSGVDPSDVKAKLVVASEIKDSMEIVHTVEYDNFLRTYLPAFRQLLKEIPPQTSETPEDKLRHMMLDILNRLPHNEVLRPLLPELLQLTMEVLVVENEENSVLWCAPCLSPHRLDRTRA
jgi:transformation/transcription domain-associated protein